MSALGGPGTYVSSYPAFQWPWRAKAECILLVIQLPLMNSPITILAVTVNCFSMSAGRSTFSSGLPLHLRELKNVHYEGSVPWMLIPDDKGVLHIAILTETSPPVTREVAENVQLYLYTKYVIVFFQVLEIKVERLSGSDKACQENFSDFCQFSSQYSIWMASGYK